MPSPARPQLAHGVRRLLAVATAGAAASAAAVVLTPAAASADHGALPDGRHVKHYTVRPGDTATGLAVRFHAWTSELISHNHLGSSAALHVGQELEIPVVTSAAGEDGDRGASKPGGQQGGREPAKATPDRSGDRTLSRNPSRAAVRAEVVRAARHYGVDPQLALAVSWQESGWQMHHVSSAGAVGAMQVLPETAEWMSLYAGRDLAVRDTRDNIAAGVLMLDVLRGVTGSQAHQIGAYYQGPGAVRSHGLYGETRDYVANVRAIKSRLEQGRPPA